MSMGQRQGIQTSAAYQVPVEWVGAVVGIEVDIPANENTVGNILSFTVEIGDTETGLFDTHGGFTWRGGGTGKDGTWNPGYGWVISAGEVGRWLRGVMVVPVRMRCGIDVDLSP